jgi:YggT family protein
MQSMFVLIAAVLYSSSCCQAFVPHAQQHGLVTSIHRSVQTMRPAASLRMMMIDPTAAVEAVTTVSSNSVLLAETEAWVQPAALVLDPFLNLMSFAMLARVVLSWYPETKLSKILFLLLVVPTEPLLRVVKGVVPPAFGVDITPVVWLAIFTFVHEILLGQQGLLTMKIKYGI